MISNEEIHAMYGKDAVVSRKGQFVLVHLDRPSADLVQARTEEFDPGTYFEDGCPICQMQRENGGVIVFDDSPCEDEEILLE